MPLLNKKIIDGKTVYVFMEDSRANERNDGAIVVTLVEDTGVGMMISYRHSFTSSAAATVAYNDLLGDDTEVGRLATKAEAESGKLDETP